MRVFVAAWPDDDIRAHLAELDLGPLYGLRPVGPRRWHVTLRFIGEVGEDLVPALSDAVQAAARGVPGPVRCRIGPSTAWFGRARVLQLPVEGLEEVAQRVWTATTPLLRVSASAEGEHSFQGHLTLARARGRVGADAVAALGSIPFEGMFDVAHIDLVRSEPSPQGHRYTTLARSVLGGS